MKHTLIAITILFAACSKDGESTSTPAEKSGEKSGEKSAERPEPVAKATPAAEAPSFVSAAGRYRQKVTFGAVSEKTVDDPNGGTWHTAKWNTREALYIVGYADYADHATAKAETMVGFIPTRDKATIKRDEPIKVGDREGRAVEWMAKPTLAMYTRFIIDGKRVYKLAAGTKGSREDAMKFFDGFEITAAK